MMALPQDPPGQGPPNEHAGAATPARERKAESKVTSILPPLHRCVSCRGLFRPRYRTYTLCWECYRHGLLFNASTTYRERRQ